MINPVESYVFIKPDITEFVGLIRLFRPQREYTGTVVNSGDSDLQCGDRVIYEPNGGFEFGNDGLLAILDEQVTHVII